MNYVFLFFLLFSFDLLAKIYNIIILIHNLYPMNIDTLTGIVIEICIKIHSKIGPGCFEKVYEEILYYELTKLGFKVEQQLLLPVKYDEMQIENAYKLDLLVEDMLVLELKSTYPLPPVFLNKSEHNYLF
jgi:GxxExxY protein